MKRDKGKTPLFAPSNYLPPRREPMCEYAYHDVWLEVLEAVSLALELARLADLRVGSIHSFRNRLAFDLIKAGALELAVLNKIYGDAKQRALDVASRIGGTTGQSNG